MQKKTARFWVLWNDSWSKISIPMGKSRDLHEFHYHDEGFSFAHERYEYHADGTITLERTSGGQDCDGPIRYYDDYECHINDMREVIDDDGTELFTPDWGKTHSEVYDAYAQAMNY